MLDPVTRGNTSAQTRSMSLARDHLDDSSLYLAITTNKETVHIFAVEGDKKVKISYIESFYTSGMAYSTFVIPKKSFSQKLCYIKQN